MNHHEVRVVTHFASLAPLSYPDAPWRISASGHTLQLHAEPGSGDGHRTRRYCVAYGAAAEYARLGMRSLGYGVIVRLAPRANDPTLMATLTETSRLHPSATERRLIAAITGAPARGATPADLSAQLRTDLRQRAADRGCWLRFLEPPDGSAGTRILVGTDSDDQLSWLRAGRTAADLIAVVTAEGWRASADDPVTDRPSASAQLIRELGLIGFPQLIAAVSRPAGRPAAAPGARRVPA